MKSLLFLFLTLIMINGYGQNFSCTKTAGVGPKIGQASFSMFKFDITVIIDSVQLTPFKAVAKCQGYSLVGFKILVDGSANEIGIADDSVLFLNFTQKWYKSTTHTVEFFCNVDLIQPQGSAAICPTGQIELSITSMRIGSYVLGSSAKRLDTSLTTQILVGSIYGSSYFTPNKVETLQKSSYVKVGEVKFDANNTSLYNDKLLLTINKTDVKKVPNLMYTIGSDTFYEHTSQITYLSKPDSLKLGESIDVQIFYQFDSSQVKLIDSIQATLELQSFDHCSPANKSVLLPILKIDQKVVKQNGINHKYQYTDFIVYPNPAHDVLNIPNLPEDSKIFIIDMNGKSIEMVAYGNQIDISSFVSGMYVIRIGEVTSKFYKQ